METIKMNEYTLLAPLDNKNAGFSRWTFATRRGGTYFLKEFQDVVYPDEQTLSATLRTSRIRACEEFEKSKSRLYRAINKISDGNVVRATEFFRYESHYYLATPKIEGTKITLAEVANLPMQDRLLICRTLAHALMRLHSAGIIHSDIKESNVLLQRTKTGRLTAKLIDFDASFFQDMPPESGEDLHFDQAYLAPEGCLFVNEIPAELTCKMDVFSAGILMHEYLTGQKPGFSPEHENAHVAVLEGETLKLSGKLAPEIRDILAHMLTREPEDRWDMETVFNRMGIFFGAKPEPPKTPKTPEPPKHPVKGSFDDYFTPVGDL